MSHAGDDSLQFVTPWLNPTQPSALKENWHVDPIAKDPNVRPISALDSEQILKDLPRLTIACPLEQRTETIERLLTNLRSYNANYYKQGMLDGRRELSVIFANTNLDCATNGQTSKPQYLEFFYFRQDGQMGGFCFWVHPYEQGCCLSLTRFLPNQPHDFISNREERLFFSESFQKKYVDETITTTALERSSMLNELSLAIDEPILFQLLQILLSVPRDTLPEILAQLTTLANRLFLSNQTTFKIKKKEAVVLKFIDPKNLINVLQQPELMTKLVDIKDIPDEYNKEHYHYLYGFRGVLGRSIAAEIAANNYNGETGIASKFQSLILRANSFGQDLYQQWFCHFKLLEQGKNSADFKHAFIMVIERLPFSLPINFFTKYRLEGIFHWLEKELYRQFNLHENHRQASTASFIAARRLSTVILSSEPATPTSPVFPDNIDPRTQSTSFGAAEWTLDFLVNDTLEVLATKDVTTFGLTPEYEKKEYQEINNQNEVINTAKAIESRFMVSEWPVKKEWSIPLGIAFATFLGGQITTFKEKIDDLENKKSAFYQWQREVYKILVEQYTKHAKDFDATLKADKDITILVSECIQNIQEDPKIKKLNDTVVGLTEMSDWTEFQEWFNDLKERLTLLLTEFVKQMMIMIGRYSSTTVQQPVVTVPSAPAPTPTTVDPNIKRVVSMTALCSFHSEFLQNKTIKQESFIPKIFCGPLSYP